MTFLAVPSGDLPALLAETPRGDLLVSAADGADMYSVTRRVGGREGSPNAFLERHVGAGLTSRNWNTVERLVARFA